MNYKHTSNFALSKFSTKIKLFYFSLIVRECNFSVLSIYSKKLIEKARKRRMITLERFVFPLKRPVYFFRVLKSGLELNLGFRGVLKKNWD